MEERYFPFIWPTWITPLLAGEDSCELKAWTKAHFKDHDVLTPEQMQEIYPESKPFDSVKWNEDHTELLNSLIDEYRPKCQSLRKEVEFKIKGKSATLSGKIDLVTTGPNLIIDAKSGKRKDSHASQVKIYQMAIKAGCAPGVSGEFTGLLRYGSAEVPVPPVDDKFKQRVGILISRLAGPDKPEPVPSFNECRFCDLVCSARVKEETVVETADW